MTTLNSIDEFKKEALNAVIEYSHKALQKACLRPPSKDTQRLVHEINSSINTHLNEIADIEANARPKQHFAILNKILKFRLGFEA